MSPWDVAIYHWPIVLAPTALVYLAIAFVVLFRRFAERTVPRGFWFHALYLYAVLIIFGVILFLSVVSLNEWQAGRSGLFYLDEPPPGDTDGWIGSLLLMDLAVLVFMAGPIATFLLVRRVGRV